MTKLLPWIRFSQEASEAEQKQRLKMSPSKRASKNESLGTSSTALRQSHAIKLNMIHFKGCLPSLLHRLALRCRGLLFVFALH